VPDLVTVVVLVALVPVVHDVSSMLTQPYWLDESWVALSVRASVGDLALVTSSTPIGWTLLLRLIPNASDLRLLTLGFDAVGVAAAYALGRLLPWPTRGQAWLAGLACGAAVLLLPAQQLRNDLKQYTADAGVTLILLALAARTESGWSRRRLGATVGAVPVCMLVSHVTAIATVAVFAGLVLVPALRRQWRRCAEAGVAAVVAVAALAVIYVTISGRDRNEALVDYWIAYFPTLGQLPAYVNSHVRPLLPLFGLPSWLLLALLLAGLVTIAARSAFAVLVAILLLPVVSVILGVAHIYPLLDVRTSDFLLVAVAAVAGLGAVGLALGLTALAERYLARGWRTPVATGLTVAVLVAFTLSNVDWYRFEGRRAGIAASSPIITEDIRDAAVYVRSHRTPRDVVLLSYQARFGVAFYWDDAPLRPQAFANSVGWVPALPSGVPFVVSAGTTPDDIAAALTQALNLAVHNGPTARVWLIRTHWTGERVGWTCALAGKQTKVVTGGVEPVVLITP
jgi:hypothetical protein